MADKKKTSNSGTYEINRWEAVAKFREINPKATHLQYTPNPSEIYDVKELQETLEQHEPDDEPRVWYISEVGIRQVNEDGTDSAVEYIVYNPKS